MNRSSRFNLNDDENNLKGHEELTVGGVKFSELESHLTSNALTTTFSDEDEDLDADVVNEAHFGGGALEARKNARKKADGDEGETSKTDNREKSKKEIMEEIILKSKMYKAEKQVEMQAQVTRNYDCHLRSRLALTPRNQNRLSSVLTALPRNFNQ